MYHYIIDAGHGGFVNGKYDTEKYYPKGKQYHFKEFSIYEGVVNRLICGKIAEFLDSYHIPYSYITESAEDISLNERVQIINRLCNEKLKKVIAFSIHCNAGGGTGFELYTCKGSALFSDEIADRLAVNIKELFPNEKLRTDYRNGHAAKKANFKILTATNCPIVLTENMFFDNYEDAKKLKNDDFLTEIARYHVNTILELENIKY